MTFQEVIENARGQVGEICKACPVCNGRACGNKVPGPGAKGVGDTAIRNYDKWQEVRLNMDTICENKPVDRGGRSRRFPMLRYGPCLQVLLVQCSCTMEKVILT